MATLAANTSATTRAFVTALERLFPDKVIPHGARPEIARRVGLGTAQAYETTKKLGYSIGPIELLTPSLLAQITEIEPPPPRPQAQPRPEYGCASCGELLTSESAHGTGFCASCRLIPIECEQCGTMFRRPSNQVMRGGRPVTTALFCGRRCSALWTQGGRRAASGLRAKEPA